MTDRISSGNPTPAWAIDGYLEVQVIGSAICGVDARRWRVNLIRRFSSSQRLDSRRTSHTLQKLHAIIHV